MFMNYKRLEPDAAVFTACLLHQPSSFNVVSLSGILKRSHQAVNPRIGFHSLDRLTRCQTQEGNKMV